MKLSLKKRSIIRQAVMEAMEQRTLFSAAMGLDTTFGTDGIVAEKNNLPQGYGSYVAVNPTNGNVFSIIAEGGLNGTTSTYQMEEFTSSGALVTSFGNNGLANSATLPYLNANVVTADVQTDGKLLVLAQYEVSQTQQIFYITRYTASGAPDSSFGNKGTASFSAAFDPYRGEDTLLILPNGTIAVPGTVVQANTSLSSITMFNSNGTPDTGFGNKGVAIGAPGQLNGIMVDSSGKVIGFGATAATSQSPADAGSAGLLERFTSAGKLDTAFGNGGSLVAPNTSVFNAGYVGSTGISVAGYVVTGASSGDLLPEVNHYTLTGTLDKTFGSGNGYLSPSLPHPIDYAFSYQTDGKLIIGMNNGIQALERLNTDGSPDNTFGFKGYADVNDDDVAQFVFAPGGKIVLPVNFVGQVQFQPLRLLTNGLPDPSFGFDGFAGDTPVYNSADAVAQLPNGQVLSVDEGTIANEQIAVIRRYNADGSIDPNFAPGQGLGGQNGSILVPANASSGTGTYSLATDAAGDIYLGESGVGIMRFTSAGKLDTTFGTNGIAAPTLVGPFQLSSNGQILATTGTNLVTRLTTSGQPDKTFNSSGTVALPSALTEQPGVFAIQSNGQILVGGSSLSPAGTTCMTVVRLNSNGSVDPTFGTNGLAIADQLPAELSPPYFRTDYIATAYGLAVLANGNIAEAGIDNGDGSGGPGIGRAGPTVAEFLSNGQLNSAFAQGGQTLTYGGDVNEQYSTVAGLIAQPDGSLVVAGTQSVGLPPSQSSLYVLRYTSAGVIDGTVVNQVIATNPNEEGPDNVMVDAVAGPDGTVVVSGNDIQAADDQTGAFLARYVTSTAMLTGTPIGTAGSYQNKGNTLAKAFDGNLSTYFDAPTASGSYVGLDLGSATVITQISYAPRAGYTSRMVGGYFEGSSLPTFTLNDVTLYTITSAPQAGVLTTVPISVGRAIRYVRYVGPANSYCNIAEMQFVGRPLTAMGGTVIGTADSYTHDGTNTITNVFDDDLSSFFDAPTASGAWVGLDLGSPQVVTLLKYAPRAGFEKRMVGGMIQASNSANFSSGVVTLYTITTVPTAGVLTLQSINNTQAFSYYRYIGPAGSYCNIADLELDG